MTIQLTTLSVARSKRTLLDALKTVPEAVRFYDPSFIRPRSFSGADMVPGERIDVVMDPTTRRRFAIVVRRLDGTFQVL